MNSTSEVLWRLARRARSGISVLAFVAVSAAAQQAELIPAGDFNTEDWMGYWQNTGALELVGNGSLRKTLACVPLTTETRSDPWSRPSNLLTLFDGKVPALKTGTRYRFSFYAFRDVDSLPEDSAQRLQPGSLRVSVHQKWDVAARKNIYREDLIPVPPSDLATPQAYAFEFKTPVIDVDAAARPKYYLPPIPFARGTNVFFQAKAENGVTGGRICVTAVSLKEVVEPVASAPAVRVNQLGYGLTGKREATLSGVSQPAGLSWTLMGRKKYANSISGVGVASGLVQATGNEASPFVDQDTGDAVGRIDFSVVPAAKLALYESFQLKVRQANGQYVVSPFFTISAGFADKLRRDALHYFYSNRAGAPIYDARYVNYRNELDRVAGHVGEKAACFVGTDLHGNYWPGCSLPAPTANNANNVYDVAGVRKLGVAGGWYDAGDHGKYTVNAAVSLWTLQNTVERLITRADGSQDYAALGARYSDNYLYSATTLEGRNGRSDLLDEARWEMEFLLRMQAPAGTLAAVPMGDQNVVFDGSKGVKLVATTSSPGGSPFGANANIYNQVVSLTPNVDVGGMAFSAVRDAKWTGLPLNPVNDTESRVLDHPTTAATLALAASGAQCYRIWKGLDAAFAARCLSAAKSAWASVVTVSGDSTAKTLAYQLKEIRRYGEYATVDHLSDDPAEAYGFYLPAIVNGGGAYADKRLFDEVYWAGMELYLATSAEAGTDTEEARRFLFGALKGANGCDSIGKGFGSQCFAWFTSLDWNRVKPLGSLSAITSGRSDADLIAKAKLANNGVAVSAAQAPRKRLRELADILVAQATESGYGVPVNREKGDPAVYYGWGSNAEILNSAVILGAAYLVDKPTGGTYLDGMVSAFNYILGRNALGKSFVTGYGSNPVMQPHHRWWSKAQSIDFPAAPPGAVVGGPNGQAIAAVVGGYQDYYESGVFTYLGGYTSRTSTEGGVIGRCMNNYGQVIAAKCYLDDSRSFQTNEVAINWNAPLFWTSAVLHEANNP